MDTNLNLFHISSSSSSSSDDEVDITSNLLEHINALICAYSSHVNAMGYYMNNVANNPQHGGSVIGRSYIDRDRVPADQRLWEDYFAETPRFNEVMFRRRFRMSPKMFHKLVRAVEEHNDYFVQGRDAFGKLGLSSFQKVTAALRILAYGGAADSTDEYLRIGESTAIESTKIFCQNIIEIFGRRYLRSPNANDVARLLKIGEDRGFPGMLGSLDCMHWEWKNCPSGWAGQYSGRSGVPTIILEAVADYDLWIWHAYFGLPGSNNDINVLEASNLFANLADGISPPARYNVGAKEYDSGYYLADGIYPKWSTLVQTIQEPRGKKKKLFAKMQEAYRKDVERAFGVLQSRFAIIKGPARFWDKSVLHNIMSACIIMHNMIIEEERDLEAPIQDWSDVSSEASTSQVNARGDEATRFQQFLARHKKIKDREAHFELRNALIEHLWDRFGNSEH